MLPVIIGVGVVATLSYIFGRESKEERLIREQQEKEHKEKLAKESKERLEKWQKEQAEKKQKHIDWRDGDFQEKPYIYECKGHPNATLAIRYGIANLERQVKEYWYYGKGGVQERNYDRDKISFVPADTIQLQKIKKVKDDPEGNHYFAKLTDFGNREVIVVIKSGTEFVQTFYPMSESWFKKYGDLENVLKDNKTFSLKELAHFHVQKVVINS
ncbi:MAG: hypothetical protein WCJ11_09325 [Methylococcaceae bacterium]